MLAVLLSASCAQDGGTESQQGAARTGISILGTAVGDDSAAAAGKGTRTAYEESDAAVKVTWVAGDAIGGYTEVDGTVRAGNNGYGAGTSGATTMFSYLSEKEVVGWADETSEHDFYACYPYAASESAADPHAHPLTLAAEQTWSSSDPLAHLAALDFMYGSALGQTQESVGALKPVPIRFRHLFSILEVRIRCNQFAEVEAVKFRCTDESEPVSLGEGSTVDLATGEITPANGTNEIRLTGSQITQLGQYVTCHLVITPGHAGKEFEIVAQVNGNDYVMTTRTAPDGGIQPGNPETGRFADGEVFASIYESVRGSDVFLVQSTSRPVNDNLMELLIMIDAMKRASAGRITAVIPYFGYARQDRKTKPRDPISAKLVANMLTAAGADRVLTMDLHAAQIQGFFDIPVDNLLGNPVFVDYYAKKFGEKCEDMVVVSPDVGSVARARAFAQKLHMNLAIVDKRRQKANQCEVMNVIGDVEGKDCILFDDMVDTAGSLCNAAKAVVEVGGARNVYACASHAVLSGPAVDRINDSVITELAFLDTIAPIDPSLSSKIKYLTVAPMFAEAIERIYQEISVSKLWV